MRLKRVGVMTMALTSGAIYAVFGLIFGFLFTIFGLLFSGLASMAGNDSGGAGAMFGAFFGVGAVVILPIFYGVLGFLGGALMAALYNLIAQLTGGIEMTLE